MSEVTIEEQIHHAASLAKGHRIGCTGCDALFASLRRLAKLENLYARSKEMLYVNEAQREGRSEEVMYDAATTRVMFKQAVLAVEQAAP